MEKLYSIPYSMYQNNFNIPWNRLYKSNYKLNSPRQILALGHYWDVPVVRILSQNHGSAKWLTWQ